MKNSTETIEISPEVTQGTIKLACEELAVIPGRAVLWANVRLVAAFALWFSLLLLAIGVIRKTLPFTMSNGAIASLMIAGTVALFLWNKTSKDSRALRRLRYDGEIHLACLVKKRNPLLEADYAEYKKLQELKDSGAAEVSKSSAPEKNFWYARPRLVKALKRHAPEVFELLLNEARALLDQDSDMAVYRVGVSDAGKYFLKRVHVCAIPCSELQLHRKSYAEAKKNWNW